MTTTITYISRASDALQPSCVLEIWAQALENNPSKGITGALYFGGDMFLHVLEGNESEVEALFARVKTDPRHEQIKVLSINDVGSALFHDTPMRLIDGSQSKVLKDKFDYDALCELGPAGADKAAFSLRRL